jgi:ABC-type xylose transport system permease subunit
MQLMSCRLLQAMLGRRASVIAPGCLFFILPMNCFLSRAPMCRRGVAPVRSALLALGGLLASMAAQAETASARTAAVLQQPLLWVCAALFALVFLAMLAAIAWHRRSVRKRGASMQEPTWVELCWTLIPMLIVLGSAWPVLRLLQLS